MFVSRPTYMHQYPSALFSFWVDRRGGGGGVTHTGSLVGKDKEDVSSCGPDVVPLPQLFKSLESNSINQAQYLWVSFALTLKRHSHNVEKKGTPAHWNHAVCILKTNICIQIGLTTGFGSNHKVTQFRVGALKQNRLMAVLEIPHAHMLTVTNHVPPPLFLSVCGSWQLFSRWTHVLFVTCYFSPPKLNCVSLPPGVDWTITAAYRQKTVQSRGRGGGEPI